MLSNQKQRQSQIIAAQRDIFPATAESYHCSKGRKLSIDMEKKGDLGLSRNVLPGQEFSIRLNVLPGNHVMQYKR